MTDTALLREKIEQSGYKLRFICEKLGLSWGGLANKIENRTEFRQSEIGALTELLQLTEEDRKRIFFASNVENISTEGAENGG